MALPREVKTKIADCCFDTPILLLGKVGENLATKVIIDASEWQDDSGTFQLLVKRADEEMFTATIEQANGVVIWLIPAAEIGAAGYGEIELNYLVGEVKMKSARVDTRVFSSIEIDSLPPNGTTWSQLVLAALGDSIAAQISTEKDRDIASIAAQRAERAAAVAEGIAADALPIASAEQLGGVRVGGNLNITAEGVLNVTTADTPEADNTLPITSAAVYAEIGNINVLLGTI